MNAPAHGTGGGGGHHGNWYDPVLKFLGIAALVGFAVVGVVALLGGLERGDNRYPDSRGGAGRTQQAPPLPPDFKWK